MRAAVWPERLLMVVGIAALAWWALLVLDAAVAQQSARSALDAAATARRPVRQWLIENAAPAAALDFRPADPPAIGSAIGTLSIPRVELSAVVLHGADAPTLRRGPGHLERTALPGEAGNVVIAGHRDSFFRPLRNIQLGDDIFLDTPEERFHYRVSSIRVVTARDLSVVDPTDRAVLTLITCYPFWVFGSAPDRFVVRAVAVG